MGQDNANIAACDRIEATLMGCAVPASLEQQHLQCPRACFWSVVPPYHCTSGTKKQKERSMLSHNPFFDFVINRNASERASQNGQLFLIFVSILAISCNFTPVEAMSRRHHDAQPKHDILDKWSAPP